MGPMFKLKPAPENPDLAMSLEVRATADEFSKLLTHKAQEAGFAGSDEILVCTDITKTDVDGDPGFMFDCLVGILQDKPSLN